jgi:hypothetical protein
MIRGAARERRSSLLGENQLRLAQLGPATPLPSALLEGGDLGLARSFLA